MIHHKFFRDEMMKEKVKEVKNNIMSKDNEVYTQLIDPMEDPERYEKKENRKV